jgi:hypothetical protein
MNVAIKVMDSHGDFAGAAAVEDVKDRIKALVMEPAAAPQPELPLGHAHPLDAVTQRVEG